MRHWIGYGLLVALSVTSCKTTEKKTEPLSWEQQEAFLKKVQDPRVFGIAVYDTPNGPEIRGGGRLHPGRAVAMEMKEEEPMRPLVDVSGNFGVSYPVLLDFTSPSTWIEYGMASELRAQPIGEQGIAVVRASEGDIPAVVSVVSSVKLDQMFVEYPLVYVRLATGSLGSINRSVSEGPVQAVVGWDILKKFDQIQLLYPIGRLLLATTEPYTPNPGKLRATLPLVEDAGICAVRGRMNGQPGNILIDPAGNFEVAADATVITVELGEGMVFSDPVTTPSGDGTVRIGARLLEQFQVSLCPKEGLIHFESVELPEK